MEGKAGGICCCRRGALAGVTRAGSWETVSSRSEKSECPADRAGGARAAPLGLGGILALLFNEPRNNFADMHATALMGKGFPGSAPGTGKP